jgi:hypothetical protein
VGSRAGFRLRIYSGANAAPGLGDEVYNGVVTLLDPTVNYAPGQTATIPCTFIPWMEPASCLQSQPTSYALGTDLVLSPT